jgi:hypothetical protein
VVYLLIVAALYAVLLRQSTAYFWLQPIIFSQVFWLTDVKRAIPLAALIWFIVVQYSVDLSGRPVGDQLGELIGPATAIASSSSSGPGSGPSSARARIDASSWNGSRRPGPSSLNASARQPCWRSASACRVSSMTPWHRTWSAW